MEPPIDDAGDPPADAGVEPKDAGTPPPEDAGPGPNCGNGIPEGTEQCDDGNQTQTDSCKNNCTYNICGDTYILDGIEECDEGDTNNGDGCSAVCLIEEPPPPDYVQVAGIVQNRGYANGANYPLNYVELQARNVVCTDGPCVKATTNATGDYSINYVPPQSTFYFDTRFVPQAANAALYEAGGALYDERYQPGGYATRVAAATANDNPTTVNTYMVKYSWLEQVAIACGIYGAGNYNDDPTYAQQHPDWSVYSAFVGFLKDEAGAGVGGIPKDRVQIELGGYLNTNPDYVCWLNDDGAGKYVGTQNATSYAAANGGFVYFKAKNAAVGGTGAGNGYVRIAYDGAGPNFVEKSVPVQAGQVGLVTLTTGDEAPPVLDLINFDLDIYPMFTQYGCVNCHKPGGAGAVMPLDGQPDEVHTNLYNGNSTCPEGGPYYRLCVNNPEYSQLLTRPLLEDPPDHPNASFPDKNHPDYVKVRAWIEQGAARVLVVEPDPNKVYTLTGVMDISAVRGCTSCHRQVADGAGGYLRPSGNLDLYGCEQYYIDNGAYATAGVDYDAATNPDYYKRDCVYYHLKNVTVADDYYYAEQPDVDGNGTAGEATDGRRVNLDYPEHSMLLRNPYCGPNYCADDDDYASATHGGPKIFANDQDPGYTAFYSWVAAGALKDGDADTYYYYVQP